MAGARVGWAFLGVRRKRTPYFELHTSQYLLCTGYNTGHMACLFQCKIGPILLRTHCNRSRPGPSDLACQILTILPDDVPALLLPLANNLAQVSFTFPLCTPFVYSKEEKEEKEKQRGKSMERDGAHYQTAA